MAVRSSMGAIIARTRLLINDPFGATQVFADQDIQDVLDASRLDVYNYPLTPVPTFVTSTVSYLDYYTQPGMGDWEDGVVLKQYMTVPVTPATTDNIVGHWTFAVSTLPPVYASGRSMDLYRAAADLLERLAARYALKFSVVADGQSLQRAQVLPALLLLVRQYRMQQRPVSIDVARSDISAAHGHSAGNALGPQPIDFFGSGDGR